MKPKEVKNKCKLCHSKAKSWILAKTGLNLCGKYLPLELKVKKKEKK